MAAQKKAVDPEPLVTTKDVMRLYGNKKTWWSEARSKLGLPYYDVGHIKYRISEVEEWIQQRRRINGRGH